MAMMLAASLVACSSGDDELPLPFPTKEAETVTEAPTPEPTAVPTATPEATPEPTPDPVSEADAQKAKIAGAFKTYLEGLASNPGPDFSPEYDQLKFGLAFVDEDDIPELLWSYSDTHASGIHVVLYNDGNPVDIGQFGEFGTLNYKKKGNFIMSNYMGMGVETEDFYKISGTKTELLQSFYSDDNTGETRIDETETSMDEYLNQLGAMTVQIDAYFSYYTATPYELSLPLTDKYLEGMADALLEDGEFYTYMNDELKGMVGSWSLTEAEYPGPTGDYEKYPAGDNASSMFTLSDNGITSLWFSNVSNGPDLSVTNYAATIHYKPYPMYDGCENNKWSAEIADAERTGKAFYATLLSPEKLMVLIVLDKNSANGESDTITCYYEPSPDYDEGPDDSYNTLLGDVRLADYNALGDDYIALTLDVKEFVSADETDKIAEYGLPADLDGYDYEIVDVPGADITFYVPQVGSTFKGIVYNPGIEYVDLSPAEFLDYLSSHYGTIFASVYFEEPYAETPIATSVEEYYVP